MCVQQADGFRQQTVCLNLFCWGHTYVTCSLSSPAWFYLYLHQLFILNVKHFSIAVSSVSCHAQTDEPVLAGVHRVLCLPCWSSLIKTGISLKIRWIVLYCIVQTSVVVRGRAPQTLTFSLTSPARLCFGTKCPNKYWLDCCEIWLLVSDPHWMDNEKLIN